MVDLQAGGGVARVFLDRPEKANALTSQLLQELLGALKGLAKNDELRVVVLGGHGRAFCGGADVAELSALEASNAGAFVEKIHLVCKAIRELPVPVVARLHGAVIGAGLEIAAACDLRIAAEGTKFSMPEVRLGIPSVVEAALLPRLMGSGRAAWLVLTGEAIDSKRAYEWGLIEQACASSELDAQVQNLLTSIIAADREALRAQKQLLQLWEEAPLSESIAQSVGAFGRSFAGGNTIASRKKGK
jgi:enoyl-CoA hydratase/carnithine racemase